MTIEETTYQSIGKNCHDAEQSQMFGKPCFKIGGKAFVCFFQQCMVFKLQGDMHTYAASLDGAVLFDPSGKKRPMKEWVQLPYAYHAEWPKLAQAAYEYVGNSER